MEKEKVTSKSIDVEIKKLELEIAQLWFDLAEKEKQKELLEELKSSESLGIDRYERPIYEGDIVRILTPSKKGPFKAAERAVVIGRSKRHPKRILIGLIGNAEINTNRESYNLEVTGNKNNIKNACERK